MKDDFSKTNKQTSFLRKDLKTFEPYNANAKAYIAKLDANESQYQTPKIVIEAMQNFAKQSDNYTIYPDQNSTQLKQAIAKHYNLKSENILCGCGSDQVIDYITKAFLNVGEIVVVVQPTFSMYSASTLINRGKVIEMQLEKDFSLDENKLIETAKQNNAKIVFLCTPNNPSGNVIPKEKIRKISKSIGALIIVDEAYDEFSQNSVVDEVCDFENIIVLRTFSKAFGLAGARIGYAIANKNLICELSLVKDPFNLPSMSAFLAKTVLQNYDLYQANINDLMQTRKSFVAELEKFEFLKVYPTCANFVLVDSKIEICEKLESAGVLVRYFGKILLEDGALGERVRITIGTKQQNKLVVDFLNQILS